MSIVEAKVVEAVALVELVPVVAANKEEVT
jgi:hypothetical protein